MNDLPAPEEFDYPGFARRLGEAMFPDKATALAGRTGVPQPTISKYLRGVGASPQLSTAAILARALDVTLEWLVWGQGDGPDRESGFVKVPRYQATLAAGAGAWNEGKTKLDDMPFTSSFLKKKLNRTSALGLSVLEARGDSMSPTIADGALVLVDEGDTRIIDSIFAFVIDGDARVKRFRRLTDGLQLISDNPAYPSETLTGEAMGRVQIIGRVRWIGQVI